MIIERYELGSCVSPADGFMSLVDHRARFMRLGDEAGASKMQLPRLIPVRDTSRLELGLAAPG
jgi:hypothetical protein